MPVKIKREQVHDAPKTSKKKKKKKVASKVKVKKKIVLGSCKRKPPKIEEKPKRRRKRKPKHKKNDLSLPQSIKLYVEKAEKKVRGAEETETSNIPPVPKVVDDIFGKKQRVNWTQVTTQLTKVSCAFTAQELLTGPPEAPYDGKFFISDHHIEWDHLVSKHKRLCILSPRDSGKCIRKNHTIQKADGSRVKVQDWQGGELLAWDEENKRYVAVQCPPVVENGVKPIYEITTATGRVLGVTEEHPLLQYQGWVHAKDIKPGDRIAVMNGVPSLGKGKLESPWLLGLLIGDGCFIGSSIQVTTTYSVIEKNIRKEVEKRGWCLVGYGTDYRIPVKGIPDKKRCDTWIKTMGLWGKKSAEKFVPEQVFEARDSDITEFLAGYFDADGSIEKSGIRASSTSNQLLNDVQSLLARLGIIASINKKKEAKYKGEPYDLWELSINSGSTGTFQRKIPLRGDKKDRLIDLLRRNAKRDYPSGKSLDRFDVSVWGDLCETEDWHHKQGGSRPSKAYSPTRQKVERVAKQENNELLLRRLKEPLFWDEVASVEIKPKEMTYAIQVPKYHTFIANDVINHNTFFFDFAYPIWKIINMPGGVGFIFSATQPMADRILGDIKNELENNPKLSWLVPSKKDLWRASSIKCSNGHTVYAKGFGTRVRGAHPAWICVDDGLTDESAYSELIRKKQIDYFYSAITNMIVPNGQIIVVGTPFAKEDLYGNLKRNPEYKFVKYEALKDGKALWPERYSVKDLKKREREIGSVRFSREFLCCKENTYVETIAGHIPIEDVKINTLVLTHKNRWKKVTRTYQNKHVGNLLRIKNTLEVTPNHKILTQDGWKEALQLTPTDFIMYPTEHGEDWMEVIDLQITYYEGNVYNLEVEEDRSYIADGIAVHNCNPIDDSSSFFPKRLFQGDPVEQYGITLGMPREYWEEKGVTIYMGVDFAMSTSVQADYTVIWVMGKDTLGNRWIIDIKRGKGLPYQEQLSMINAIGHKYQPALIHLEANQMQRIFGDELIRVSDLPIRQFVTGIQKHSLTIGLPSMRILLENQKFRIPRGDHASVLATDAWIDELASFTYENGKLQTVGAHDDLAMASWICNEAIRIGGFQFSFGLTEKETDEIRASHVQNGDTSASNEDLDNATLDDSYHGQVTPDGFTLENFENPTNGGGRGNGNGNGKVKLVEGNAKLKGGKAPPSLVDDDQRQLHSLLNVPEWY